MKLTLWLLIPIICFGGYRVLEILKDTVLPHAYIFNHHDLQAMSKQVLADVGPQAAPNVIFEALHVKLKEKYGDYINEYNYDNWMFSNAGGAMVCCFFFFMLGWFSWSGLILRANVVVV